MALLATPCPDFGRLYAVLSALNMEILPSVWVVTSRVYFLININTPSPEKGRQTGTPSQTIKPLCRNIINPHVSRLVCILYVIVFGMGHVLALDTCVIYMCTESSGAIAVYLTDTSPGCVSPAQNYMISKCGVNYSGRTCYVDCNSIYSWSGSYWRAAGCNGLGNPCGVQTECDSSVLNVCPA